MASFVFDLENCTGLFFVEAGAKYSNHFLMSSILWISHIIHGLEEI